MIKTSRLLMIIICLSFLTACSTVTGGNDTEETEASNDTSKNDEERVLNISLGADMLTWDIHDHTTTTTEAVHINVFDYLIMRDWANDGEYKPHLATEWKQVDEKTWNFKLRDDVEFHNGEKLTAEDVKYTLERVANDTSLKSNGHYDTIESVDVIGDYEFNIVTSSPDPMLLSRISRQASGILPKGYIEENGFDHFLKNPVGSGPLKYEDWERDQEIVLTTNENYFGEAIAEWDKVVFKTITEDSTRVSELMTGGLDIAANVPPSDWERINNHDSIELLSDDSNRTYLLFLDMEEGKPASDPRVREAIDYAINDKAIVDQLLDGGGTTTLTRVNPGNFGFHEALYNDYNYDVEHAKELLSDAGYADGLNLEIMGPQGRYLQDTEVLQMIAGMMSEAGITVNTNILEYSVYSENRSTGDFEDGYLIALGASFFDAGQSLAYYSPETTSHSYGYDNSEVTDLLLEAETTTDEEMRKENYKHVQEIAAEEKPFIVLFQIDQFYGVNSNIDMPVRLDEVIYVPDLEKK